MEVNWEQGDSNTEPSGSDDIFERKERVLTPSQWHKPPIITKIPLRLIYLEIRLMETTHPHLLPSATNPIKSRINQRPDLHVRRSQQTHKLIQLHPLLTHNRLAPILHNLQVSPFNHINLSRSQGQPLTDPHQKPVLFTDWRAEDW